MILLSLVLLETWYSLLLFPLRFLRLPQQTHPKLQELNAFFNTFETMRIPKYNAVPLAPSLSVFNKHPHHHHYQSEISLTPLTPPSTFQGLENGTSTFNHESASLVPGGQLYDDDQVSFSLTLNHPRPSK
jgi:hypothetical protein